ncbi:hypothetical protein PIB30_029163 [Stylosanthes scabra]|uniref:Uncharacterized protein n=1 Tax=Stylosanthes scabra TaxID=79078 RepID=A0ABU6YD18_9FABA|nr:hypothetical protein [Stylosanthes scabra]
MSAERRFRWGGVSFLGLGRFHDQWVDFVESSNAALRSASRDANNHSEDGPLSLETRERHTHGSTYGVKNYSIRRATEYKVLESDSMKYHYVCKWFRTEAYVDPIFTVANLFKVYEIEFLRILEENMWPEWMRSRLRLIHK